MTSDRLHVDMADAGRRFAPGTIVAAADGQPVTFEVLIQRLAGPDVVYVGERHTDPTHHDAQLRVVRALYALHPDLIVGMEMFDRTYQPVLDRWSAGELSEADFLRQVHWYANWKYDWDLYRDILVFIRDHHIRLVGLNLPFHIPPRIAVGGLANLSVEDRGLLAAEIDTTNPLHRAYVAPIFSHHRLRGRDDFEYFYEAQCAWEDTMAESVARALNGGRMVVLVGNGHIIHKFGIPDRAFRRGGRPFATVVTAPADSPVFLDEADYIWVTPESDRPGS